MTHSFPLRRSSELNPPAAPGGRRIKRRYITQARTRPPTFIVFGNRLDELPESYRRYLVNALRTGLDFDGVPIRLNLRSRTNPFDRLAASPSSTRGASGVHGPRSAWRGRCGRRAAAVSRCWPDVRKGAGEGNRGS